MNKCLEGHSLAGMSTSRNRIVNDFYATPEESTKALLEVEEIIYPALEPACGAGHISKLLDETQTLSFDLVDRGFSRMTVDYLDDFQDVMASIVFDTRTRSGVKTIITNPPFNLFQEFAERSLEIAENKVILFGKLQALEGQKRATFMESSPLKTVYVFKKRQNPLRNGSPVDEKGKPWASTMAFAWFIWEQGYTGEPQIRWI